MTLLRIALALCLLCTIAKASAQPRVLDDFDTIDAWSTYAPEGVTVTISPSADGALRIDYSFDRGGGFAIVRRSVDLDVGANYAFDFRVRGEGPPNDLEFKLSDSSGDNVWWHNRRKFAPPSAWTNLTSSRRTLEFAWGPTQDRTLRHVSVIEFAIASASGGNGTIYLDDLRYSPMPEPLSLDAPVSVTSLDAQRVVAQDKVPPVLLPLVRIEKGIEIDLTSPRPLGGLVVEFAGMRDLASFDIKGLDASKQWVDVASIDAETESAIVTFNGESLSKLSITPTNGAASHATLVGLRLLPIQAHENPNTLMEILARSGQRTLLPECYSGERIFWTVSGLPGTQNEALLDELGSFEPVKAGPRLQPAIIVGGELHGGWDADTRSQSLLDGWMPIPSASWTHGDLQLTAVLIPNHNGSFSTQYMLTNHGSTEQEVSLVLAVRPFQVLPQWQFLNTVGGVAPIGLLDVGPETMHAEGEAIFHTDTPASRVAATSFGAGEIMQRLANRSISLDVSARAQDPAKLASGAWVYDFTLRPGVWQGVTVTSGPPEEIESFEIDLVHAQLEWRDMLGSFWLHLPESQKHLEDTVRASIAYALVNQDGPAIRPGSRTYERTWIRDGSLTSHALLGAGLRDNVERFITWYSGYLFENGKAPCVVDHRGADPVDEHDSTGQYIHILWAHYLQTRSQSLLQSQYESVQRAMGYIESLRATRMGAPYNDPSAPEHVFFGLVPESISHEGYSAKPMHSYWDDFFILLGISDAANIARVLGHEDDANRWSALEDDFRTTLDASIALAMKNHSIDYIPGCAELGDFDATSTAIAAFPVGELESLPKEAVNATFDRYWRMFVDRRDGNIEWRDYTPYEVRVIGAMSDMGRPERAHQMVDYFLSQQTPIGWRQWPEVVHRDLRGPGFIGDLPHTWVSSDFVNSIAAMLVSIDRDATRLTLAKGLSLDWIEGEGLRVVNLSTSLGLVSWSARREGDRITIDITKCERLPSAGIWLDLTWLPEGAKLIGVSPTPAELRIDSLPAHVEIELP